MHNRVQQKLMPIFRYFLAKVRHAQLKCSMIFNNAESAYLCTHTQYALDYAAKFLRYIYRIIALKISKNRQQFLLHPI